jgi:hypothetical protein
MWFQKNVAYNDHLESGHSGDEINPDANLVGYKASPAFARNSGEILETRVPTRLDRLPWGKFHTLVVAALGITWVLDGLELHLRDLSPAPSKRAPACASLRRVASYPGRFQTRARRSHLGRYRRHQPTRPLSDTATDNRLPLEYTCNAA